MLDIYFSEASNNIYKYILPIGRYVKITTKRYEIYIIKIQKYIVI